MKVIDFNNWYVKNNNASISLPHLHAKFSVLNNNESVYYQLKQKIVHIYLCGRKMK